MPRRFKSPASPFIDRIAEQKRRLEAEAAKVAPGPARDGLLKKVRQLDVAAHLNDWLSSPGLQTPR